MKNAMYLLLAACLGAGAAGCDRPTQPSSEQPRPLPPAEQSEPAAPPPAALDLSRQHISDIASEQEQALTEPPPLLPDLFDAKRNPGVKVDGRLITDDTAKDLNDKVDGAELTIEIPTT